MSRHSARPLPSLWPFQQMVEARTLWRAPKIRISEPRPVPPQRPRPSVLQPDSEFDHPNWDMTSPSANTATPVSAFFNFACYERDRSDLTAEPFYAHQSAKREYDSVSEHPQDNVTEEAIVVAAAHAEIDIERTIEDEDRNVNQERSESHDGPVDNSQMCVAGLSHVLRDTDNNETGSVLRSGEWDPQHASDLARCDSISRTRDRIEEENDNLRRRNTRSRGARNNPGSSPAIPQSRSSGKRKRHQDHEHEPDNDSMM